MKKFSYIGLLIFGFIACSVEPTEETLEGFTSFDIKAQKAFFDVPILSCGEATDNTLEVVITAGETGAMGGFKFRWMTKADFDTYGWNEEYFCEQNFKANPANESYSLEPGESFTIHLEDYIENQGTSCNRSLECGLEYVFRVQAHNESGKDGLHKSEWSEVFYCSTQACEEICTYGYGYWRNHGPESPGNQENSWPVNTLELGGKIYNANELLSILNTPVHGDEIISLLHHLIAAKFNIKNGVDSSGIESTIETADKILAEEVDKSKDEINEVKDALETFNESNKCDE